MPPVMVLVRAFDGRAAEGKEGLKNARHGAEQAKQAGPG